MVTRLALLTMNSLLGGTSSPIKVLNISCAFAASSIVPCNKVLLSGSIVPPLPFRFKVTRGDVSSSPRFTGEPGVAERVDGRFYWGVKFERVPISGSDTDGKLKNAILSPNESDLPNACVAAYTKFLGIKKLDVLVNCAALVGTSALKGWSTDFLNQSIQVHFHCHYYIFSHKHSLYENKYNDKMNHIL